MTAVAEWPETDTLRGMTWGRKQALLLALLREAMALNGDTGLLPVEDEAGRPFGYYVPPKAAAELYRETGPSFSPEEEQELDGSARDIGGAIPISQAAAEFRRRAAEWKSKTPSLAAHS